MNVLGDERSQSFAAKLVDVGLGGKDGVSHRKEMKALREELVKKLRLDRRVAVLVQPAWYSTWRSIRVVPFDEMTAGHREFRR